MPTKIEWAEETWNPITGCTPVSAGCQNCYARRRAEGRFRGRFGYPADEPFRVTVHPDRFDQPLKWRKPCVIFVCSMGDLFHEDVPRNALAAVFDTMRQADRHWYVLLTKRPMRMYESLSWPEVQWPPHRNHIAVGVTVENEAVLRRMGDLTWIPWRPRFVSCEPLLGPMIFLAKNLEHISGVIVGSETGPGARPLDLDWARSIRDQCRVAGVKFFLKQTGKRPGKERILDGREHNALPWGQQ